MFTNMLQKKTSFDFDCEIFSCFIFQFSVEGIRSKTEHKNNEIFYRLKSMKSLKSKGDDIAEKIIVQLLIEKIVCF